MFLATWWLLIQNSLSFSLDLVFIYFIKEIFTSLALDVTKLVTKVACLLSSAEQKA